MKYWISWESTTPERIQKIIRIKYIKNQTLFCLFFLILVSHLYNSVCYFTSCIFSMKKFLFVPVLLLLSVSSLFGAEIVWNDRDVHGCIGSAGYSWSQPLGKCIRTWEYYTVNIFSDMPVTGIEKLDTRIHHFAESLLPSFRREAETFYAENPDITVDTERYSLLAHYDMTSSGNIVSIKMEVSTFLGGAHGSTQIYTWNYDRKTGKFLHIRDFFSPIQMKSLAEKVRTELTSYYKANNYELDPLWLNGGTHPRVLKNYANFTVDANKDGSPKTLTIYFWEYQVGPYAIGRPKIQINLSTFSIKAL